MAHLGSHTDFLDKFDPFVTEKVNVVAIADDARWIWGFRGSCYSGAVQALDYFYAVEKIGNWAKSAIKKERPAKDWIGLQEEYLLNDDVEETINALRGFPNDAFIKEKRQLLTYLRNNAHRMRYRTFQDKGYLIGSEPIEAANKQVAQARLKKLEPRWTPRGLQQVTNLRVALRVAKHSGKWNTVVNQKKAA
jgi:hypothetical protein